MYCLCLCVCLCCRLAKYNQTIQIYDQQFDLQLYLNRLMWTHCFNFPASVPFALQQKQMTLALTVITNYLNMQSSLNRLNLRLHCNSILCLCLSFLFPLHLSVQLLAEWWVFRGDGGDSAIENGLECFQTVKLSTFVACLLQSISIGHDGTKCNPTFFFISFVPEKRCKSYNRFCVYATLTMSSNSNLILFAIQLQCPCDCMQHICLLTK